MCFLTEIDTGKEKMISEYDSLIKITKEKDGKSVASVNPDVFHQLEKK
jgi:hypothetical protein